MAPPKVNDPVKPSPRPPSEVPKETGTLTGIVRFEGEPPRRAKIQLNADAYCASQHPEGAESEEVCVRDGHLANVLVFLKGIRGKFDVPEVPFLLDQKGCTYRPHVVALRVGQKLLIRNSDPTSHNVHFLPENNREDNFSQSRKGMERELTFKEAEIGGRIKCDVHPWMNAVLHVMKHPFFAVTMEDGAFAIDRVPPGDYTLMFWHESADRREGNTIVAQRPPIRVHVDAGKTTEIEMVYRRR